MVVRWSEWWWWGQTVLSSAESADLRRGACENTGSQGISVNTNTQTGKHTDISKHRHITGYLTASAAVPRQRTTLSPAPGTDLRTGACLGLVPRLRAARALTRPPARTEQQACTGAGHDIRAQRAKNAPGHCPRQQPQGCCAGARLSCRAGGV